MVHQDQAQAQRYKNSNTTSTLYLQKPKQWDGSSWTEIADLNNTCCIGRWNTSIIAQQGTYNHLVNNGIFSPVTADILTEGEPHLIQR